MANLLQGRQAEKQAADYLITRGFKIIDQNYKTRVCEIDLIAIRNKRIHFIEVKYRRGNQQGSGFDYITPPKLRRMRFAAELWVANKNWQGEYSLSAIEVSGPAFVVTGFVEDCS